MTPLRVKWTKLPTAAASGEHAVRARCLAGLRHQYTLQISALPRMRLAGKWSVLAVTTQPVLRQGELCRHRGLPEGSLITEFPGHALLVINGRQADQGLAHGSNQRKLPASSVCRHSFTAFRSDMR